MKDIENQFTEFKRTLDEQINSIQPNKLRAWERFLSSAATELRCMADKCDPIKNPEVVFDPSNPDVTGRLAACTLLIQDRHSFESLPKFYGAGVYAIYYVGPFDPYRIISKTESPVYVGKADPASPSASTPKEQGVKLYSRLMEHRRSIGKAQNINANEFEVRYLVIKTGMQTSAESCLINYFKPIWNKEIKVCFGIGSHGDDKENTRTNKRSPWDTMHPGRQWAAVPDLEDQKPYQQIVDEIVLHCENYPPLRQVDFYKLLKS